jgi:hypothetical protein
MGLRSLLKNNFAILKCIVKGPFSVYREPLLLRSASLDRLCGCDSQIPILNLIRDSERILLGHTIHNPDFSTPPSHPEYITSGGHITQRLRPQFTIHHAYTQPGSHSAVGGTLT